jgi:hypothetical protein
MRRLIRSGNGTSVQIGNLGVVESTPPNNTKPEISTGNYQSKTRPPLIAVYGVVVFLIMKN